MATMSVSLSDRMKAWVDAQTEQGGYADEGAYVRALIAQDQERQAKIAALQGLLDEGRASGPGSRSMDEILAEARRRAGTDAL